MKKPLLATLGVAIAYAGAAWYTGYVGEQKFNEQLALSQQQSAASGMVVEKVKYERGIFTSQVELAIKPISALMPLQQVTMTSSAQHGPLLFGKGLGVGLFDMNSEIKILLRDEQLNSELQAAIGDKLGKIHTRAYLDASYDGVWDVAAIEEKNDKVSFTMQPSSLTFSGKLDSLSGKGTLNIGAIEVAGQDGTNLTVSPMTGDFSVDNLEPGLNITNMQLAMPELKGTNNQGVPFALEGVTLAQIQALNNDKVDTQVKLDMAKLVGPVVVEKGYYHISINQIDKAAIKSMSESMAQAAGVTDPQALQMVYLQMFTQALPLLLQDGLAMQLAMGAEFMGGKSEAQWDIKYVPPADGKSLMQLQGADAYIKLVDSDLLVKAPAGLLQATPASSMVGTYVMEEDGYYVLKATLKNGELVVGNTPVPPEQWMGALSSMMMLAQAGQQPSEEEAAMQAEVAEEAELMQEEETEMAVD